LIYATDFSDESLQVLAQAVAFANVQRTRLVLLHLISDVPNVKADRWYTPADVSRIRTATRNDAYQRLRGLVDEVDLNLAPLCMVEFGEPAEGILWAARNLQAAAIILGLKHRRGAIWHMPSSTAYRVVCGAGCPVVTIRA